MDIYVGNLPYAATDDDLAELFEAFGAVESSKVIIDRESGQSKGFGFVKMSDKEEGDAAISQLDGSNFMGRRLKVNESQRKQQPDKFRRGGGGGGGGGNYGRRPRY